MTKTHGRTRNTFLATFPRRAVRSPHLALWRTVILYGLKDVITATKRADREAARRWFYSKDFRKVCALAGLEPEAIQRSLAQREAALDRGDKKAAVAGLTPEQGRSPEI